MALWQMHTELPLLTLIICLCPQALYGETVRCWWHKVAAAGRDVSIECEADSQDSKLKCGLCHLRVIGPGASQLTSKGQCSNTNAIFSTLIREQEMPNVTCSLLCPGHAALNCIVQEGYPPPVCLIKDEERNIHCHWTYNLLNPTDFTLHWKQDHGHGYSGSIEVGPSPYGIIPRANYTTHSHIRVWVSAANTFGVLDSEAFETFTTENIIKPPTPEISSHTFDPLEILWRAKHSKVGQCEVQYRKQCEQFWTEDENRYDTSFSLEDPVPFTRYTFRVRCWFVNDGVRSISSDWSKEYSVETPAAAPVGKLDVWSDCDPYLDDSSCTILWKEFPKQQARGVVSGYVVTIKRSNGSDLVRAVMNRSAEMCEQCVMQIANNESANMKSRHPQRCPQKQNQNCFHFWHLTVPVGIVKDVLVTANTTQGESSPALVALPRTAGLSQPLGVLEVRGGSQELSVSWSLPPQFSKNVQEYVVQLKPAGLRLTSCLNWVRVHKNQTSVTLRGQLSNYTAYNVSLFAVVNNGSCLLNSSIAYTVEGVPASVTDFHTVDICLNTVTLKWTPIPTNNSSGHILKYLVGLYNDTKVYSVDSNRNWIQLLELKPGQSYEAWISALTVVGKGERTTTRFTTRNHGDGISYITLSLCFIASALVLMVTIVCYLNKHRCQYRIPDPINSTSFKQISNQLWLSWPSASMERGLTISQVEVIVNPEPPENDEKQMFPEVQHQGQLEMNGEIVEGGEIELQKSKRLERIDSTLLPKRNEYSQVIDSTDEESREDEDDEWNDQTSTSDYEKHFLPCIIDT